ncbi:maleylpyruvate isomerase N-terminal domain-containing protein [Micromonospora orduensis]|uniref:maleylpyruvate isomerase N-terminal domain-containing protein n=1 Tax=Micromonospora orduensis TaxID=1420891 RepID=UPI0038167404
MDAVRAAFRAECATLTGILAELDDAGLDRPTTCPPWAVRDLIAHVRTGAGRLADMLAAPAPPRAEDAAGYFGAAKFTPEVDAARIEAARSDAARSEAVLSTAGAAEAERIAGGGWDGVPVGRSALPGEFERSWRAADAAVAAAPPERVVRTRHGDAMSLTEFLRTRVVEVGVHGLDLAVALDRPPWLTPQAAAVIADLLTGGRPAPAGLCWDRLTLIRKTTGRAALTPAERAEVDAAGFRWLAFGR